MPSFNTDFLKYDARNIKSGIVQRLTNNSDFTDQLFEGSNMTTLIDMFSYMFEVLQYYVNHGASEAIFNDAQLYENMNRIVKMLGYNPFGYSNPETSVSFSVTDAASALGIFGNELTTKTLPKYTRVNTDLTDSNGEEVYYSFVQNLLIQNNYSATSEDTVLMVNGKWVVYDKTLISTGQPLETFILDLIGTVDDERPTYVSHPYVDVYVKRIVNDVIEYVPYTAVWTGTLFGTETQLFGPNDRVFELRMNENKQYEIKFGDGIHGEKLLSNDELYVIYLKGNGSGAQIGADIINENSVKEIGIAGLDLTTMAAMLSLELTTDIISTTELAKLIFTNVSVSSTAQSIEDVNSIRQNAPNFFRMGGRLVTARDYKDFITATFRNSVYDVNVMNNWEYMASFHKWLYDLDLLTSDIRELDYFYADSCDFNNVYIWTKFKGEFTGNVANIERTLLPRKVLTAEPIIQNALDIRFIPAHTNNGYSIDNWDPNIENWIEILKDKNSLVPAEKISETAITLINNFFDPKKLYIGQVMNLNDLNIQLNSIEGVKSVRTVFKEGGIDSSNLPQFVKGLRFAHWTKALVDGADLALSIGNIDLEDFQFPVLDSDIRTRVKVVFESFGQPSIEY